MAKLYAKKVEEAERDLEKIKQNFILEEYEDEKECLMRNNGVTNNSKGVK